MKCTIKKPFWKNSLLSIVRYWNSPYQPLTEKQISQILSPIEKKKSFEDVSASYSSKGSDSFSWIDKKGKNYVSGVKNQRFCNSCGAFSVIAALEIQLKIDFGKEVLFSEGHMFFINPWYSRKKKPGSHNCRKGLKIEPALNYLVSPGVLQESDYPYNPLKKIFPLPVNWSEKTTTITTYEKIEGIEKMKSWIREKGPLVSSIPYPKEFLFYKEGIYTPRKNTAPGEHGLCIVGYDDNRQAWLCKNSWGRGWGIEGFGWLAYDKCGIEKNAWGIEGIKTPGR